MLPKGHLEHTAVTSAFVAEVANLRCFKRQLHWPMRLHAQGRGACRRSSPQRTYEHIEPELVGNKQRIILSDLAGQSNILFKAKQYGFELDKGDPFVLELLTELKNREDQGYEYSAAEGILRATGGLRVLSETPGYFSS